jgi:hypothetical protein
MPSSLARADTAPVGVGELAPGLVLDRHAAGPHLDRAAAFHVEDVVVFVLHGVLLIDRDGWQASSSAACSACLQAANSIRIAKKCRQVQAGLEHATGRKFAAHAAQRAVRRNRGAHDAGLAYPVHISHPPENMT